jgi:hypothetical protein
VSTQSFIGSVADGRAAAAVANKAVFAGGLFKVRTKDGYRISSSSSGGGGGGMMQS